MEKERIFKERMDLIVEIQKRKRNIYENPDYNTYNTHKLYSMLADLDYIERNWRVIKREDNYNS